MVGIGWHQTLLSHNSLGIIAGLVLGKPLGKQLGITLLCVAATALGLCKLPGDVGWRHIFGAGLLGGIGFKMSIFITNLAFAGDGDRVDGSKMAILLASSLAAGLLGCSALRWAR